jgi:ribosomal protein S1
MSLINCPECTRRISSLAETCPGCGAPVNNPVYKQLPKVGETYDGTVSDIKEFGVYIEFMQNKKGLLHISEISWKRVETLEGLYHIGDKVKVKLVAYNPEKGTYSLSHKQTLPKNL